MTWSTTPPTQPGRYWWRTGPQARGLVLVKWVAYDRMAPELRPVSEVVFSRPFSGEDTRAQGWEYGGGGSMKDFVSLRAGIEFWSEPERGPEDFLPELPGRPDWTPPERPDPVETVWRQPSRAAAAAGHTRIELRHNGERSRAESAWTFVCSCGAQESASTRKETLREWRCHLEQVRATR